MQLGLYSTLTVMGGYSTGNCANLVGFLRFFWDFYDRIDYFSATFFLNMGIMMVQIESKRGSTSVPSLPSQ